MNNAKKYIIPALVAVLGILLIIFPPKRLGILDSIADGYFEESVTKASIAYGTTRLINAGVSVVKDSTLQLEPGGVGVAIAAGQVADPLDDMTERLSSVLVTSIVSLLVQKISYEIAQYFVFQLVGFLLIAISVLSLFKYWQVRAYRNLAVKLVLFLFVIRLFLPVSALISNQLNEKLFFPRIAEYEEKLAPFVEEFKGLTEFEVPEVKGIGDIFSGPVRMMNEKSSQMNYALALMVSNGMSMFQNLLGMMSLYLGVFVIQVLFLPLLMFWLINKLLFILFAQQIQPRLVFGGENKSEEKQPV